MPVSFKIQNRIYHMFQYSWTGDSSFFCNMSDNKNRNPKPFCKLHQRICCLSDLRHTSRCGTDFFTVHCLNRINDHGIWFFLFNHIANQFQISLTKQKQMFIKFSHPLCTQFNLAKRFFPWYVQNLSFFFCQFLTHLQEQRWLTDSRITAYQNQGTRYDSASQYTIQFFNLGCHPLFILCLYFWQWYNTNLFCRFNCCRIRRCHTLFHERVPFLAHWALPQPFWFFMSTILAEKNRLFCLRHIPSPYLS